MDEVVEQKRARGPRQGVAVLLPVEFGERLAAGRAHGGQIAAVEADKQRAVLGDGKIGEALYPGKSVAQRLVDKGGDAGAQALGGQFQVHRGGGVDHHPVGEACQQVAQLGEALGDPVLAGQLVQYCWIAGTEQRGDSLVTGQQRQIGFLGDITKTYEGNAHDNSLFYQARVGRVSDGERLRQPANANWQTE